MLGLLFPLLLLIRAEKLPESDIADFKTNNSCKTFAPNPLKSRHLSETELNVTLTNVGEESIDLYWIDYSGSEVFIDSIDKDDTTTFTTYSGMSGGRIFMPPDKPILRRLYRTTIMIQSLPLELDVKSLFLGSIILNILSKPFQILQ